MGIKTLVRENAGFFSFSSSSDASSGDDAESTVVVMEPVGRKKSAFFGFKMDYAKTASNVRCTILETLELRITPASVDNMCILVCALLNNFYSRNSNWVM